MILIASGAEAWAALSYPVAIIVAAGVAGIFQLIAMVIRRWWRRREEAKRNALQACKEGRQLLIRLNETLPRLNRNRELVGDDSTFQESRDALLNWITRNEGCVDEDALQKVRDVVSTAFELSVDVANEAQHPGSQGQPLRDESRKYEQQLDDANNALADRVKRYSGVKYLQRKKK